MERKTTIAKGITSMEGLSTRQNNLIGKCTKAEGKASNYGNLALLHCHGKPQETGWLERTEMNPLRVLESSIWIQDFGRVGSSGGWEGRDCSKVFLWFLATSCQTLHPSSRGLSPWVLLCTLHSFHGDINHWWLRTCPNLIVPHLNSISKDPISQ